MKNILLYISCFLITTNLFSQVRMDVWNKNPNTSRTVSMIGQTQLPKTFESRLPDGSTEIYDKWDVPTIEVETSTKQKYTFKPKAYKGRKSLTILTYTENGWEGMYQSINGDSYSMTPSSIKKDTIRPKNSLGGCGTMIPPNASIDETTQRTPPPTSNLLTNSQYYDPSITINKNLTVYAEVTNDLHVSLGNNLTTTQNWVTNLFLAVSSIYASEGLIVTLNKIYVWQSVDPYGYQTTSSSPCILGGGSFYGPSYCTGFTDNINNNLPVNPNNTTTGVKSYFKHLLHGRGSLGGVAWLGGNSDGYNPDNFNVIGTHLSTAVSGFTSTTIPNQPTTGYNWPVYVTAHEMGHNCGSSHTQWCRWKNDQGVSIGRLDSCYTGEYNNPGTFCSADAVEPCPANCIQSTYAVTKPNNNGTIMSYCHLNGAVNLSERFGKYPRFAMRNAVDRTPYITDPISNLPQVATSNVTSVTSFTFTCGGNVTNDGGSPVTARGICWAPYPAIPTISDSKTSDGVGTGSFTSTATNLTPAVGLYLRSYATNSNGTTYGSIRLLTPGPPVPPVLTTVPINTVGQTTAKSGGTISNSGGGTIVRKGVFWSIFSISDNTDIDSESSKTNDGTGTANFISSITGLTLGVTYYVRAYAESEYGIGWGNELTFTTSTATAPTLTTTSVTTFTNTTATMGGNVTATNGANVTARGVCYATTTNPDLTKTVVTIGSGTGTFSQSVTGLSQGVTYYVRAYATNLAGTTYGTQVSFTTLTTPTVTTTAATNIAATTVTSGGNVTSAGGGSLTVTGRGVCYATTTNPTISNSVLATGTGTGTFTSNITGLTQGVTYYVRAYATNTYGTSYGSQITFKTLTVPTVTTTAATSVTQTSANSGGNVTSAGGGTLTVTGRGVCYATTQNPTIANSVVASGTGTGAYTTSLTGLTPGTVYYARAYATNSVGTGYGSQITITTPSVPVLTTTTITSISSSGAISGGTISSSVGSSVTAKGVVWSTNISPTIALSTKTSNGTGTVAYTSTITGLSPSTTYYVRAYATNTTGTGYGNELSFTTTSSGSVPSLTTTAVTSITQTTASSGGNVTSDGGLTVTARGVCYATTQNPTIANSIVAGGTGTGSFTSSITGLTASTTYYVRAYATNSNGTSYGTQVSFTTLATTTTPVVTTTSITSITSTGASTGGNVTSAGGLTVTARGVCYATTQNPTITNSVVTSGSGTGVFTSSLSGLTPSTTYYVRAYATNSLGTAYGTQQSFTTLANNTTPVVTTTAVTSITQTTASSGGNVTSAGGLTVTARGVCYATTQNPTISNSVVVSGTGTGVFTSSITGLTASTTYYVRAYATNSLGTSYGTQVSFTTLSVNTTPVVTTTAVTSITQTTSSSGGNVTSDGGLTVTARGVCYATTQNPTIANSIVAGGTGTGTFTSSITGLSPSTIYYVRAYATNSLGTSYGTQVSFTTLSNTTPLVTTSSITSITSNSATAGGDVTSAGGLTVTARGVCYATTQNPTIANSVVTSGTGTGVFTSSITGLSSSTTYYVRAYATNSLGTSYGTQQSFTTSTSVGLPVVTTTSASAITPSSAVSGGNVTSAGSNSVTSRGVCWSTSTSPTIANSKTTDGSGIGVFTSTLTSLTASTTYYVRSYATSTSGTAYGNEIQLTTTSAPSTSCQVTTFAASNPGAGWRFKWNINSNCTSYTVTLSRYNYTNPSISPPVGATPVATGNRLVNYVPTSTEIGQGFIDQQMNPQPASLGYWYTFEVKCNATTCSGSNTTKSGYFYATNTN